MAEPSKLPEWATDVSAKIVQPAEVKKKAGWVQEIPPCEWFNWWMNNVYKWILHFKETLVTIASGISTNTGDIDTLKTDVGNLETAVDTLETAVGTVSYGNFDVVFPDTQFTTEQTINIKYKKEVLTGATAVTLFIPSVIGVSNGATITANGTPIPAAIRPSEDKHIIFPVYSTSSIGKIVVGSAGDLAFYAYTVFGEKNIEADAFSNTGSKGFHATVIQYTV